MHRAHQATGSSYIYRITGIICGRKVLQIAFFAVVRKKTFVIQVISLYRDSGRGGGWDIRKCFRDDSRYLVFVAWARVVCLICAPRGCAYWEGHECPCYKCYVALSPTFPLWFSVS